MYRCGRRHPIPSVESQLCNPAVGVLLATYKPRPEWLRAAIDSVCAQTFASFEVLVLDDGRSDYVRLIAESYQDERIRYLPGLARGPGANHASGIDATSAPLIAIINHDDVWEPTMLDKLVSAYQSTPNAVVAFADHWVIDESGRVNPERSDQMSSRWQRDRLRPGVHQPFARLALVDGTLPIAVAAVFERDATNAGRLPAWSGQVYDRYLAYLLARTERAAVYVPERLAAWRESSLNRTTNRSIAGSLAHLRMSWCFFGDPALHELRTALGKMLIHSARGVLGTVLYATRRGVARRLCPARRQGPIH